MSSGRVQLAAVGIQDEFLTGSPEVTYFIKRFSRYTKFALETLDNTFDQQAIDFGSFITCTVPRKGQLIRGMYLKLVLPDLLPPTYGYTDAIGNAIVEHADLLIGGKVVERINGEYMQIYAQTFLGESQQTALKYLTGDTKAGLGGLGPASTNQTATAPFFGPYPRTLLVPLPFYFHRSESLAVPLCALTRQEVEIHVKLRPLEQLIAFGTPSAGQLISWQPLTITSIKFSRVTWLQNSLAFALMDESPVVRVFNPNSVSLIPIDVSPWSTFKCVGICDLPDPIVVAVSSAPCPAPITFSSTNIFGIFQPVPTDLSDLTFRDVASDGRANVIALATTQEIVWMQFPQGAAWTVTRVPTSSAFVTVTWNPSTSQFLFGTDDPNIYDFDMSTQTFSLLYPGAGPYYQDPLSDTVPFAWDEGNVFSNIAVTSNLSDASQTQAVPAFTRDIAWSPLFKKFMIVGDYGGFWIGTEPDPLGAQAVTASGPLQVTLPVEYVFLGDDEVYQIQNAKVDYVITQLQQYQGYVQPGVTSVPMRLQFTNPVKELFLVIQDQTVLQNNDWFNYKNTWMNGDQLATLRLDFNGETILSDVIADELYLSILQFLQGHTRVPEAYVYNLSFSIDPENHLPTGQINFSRIANQNMYLTTTENPNARVIRILAKSYNILRVQCGLAGLLFTDNCVF